MPPLPCGPQASDVYKRQALAQFIQYDGSREEQILANEDKLDTYEDRLGGYLVQILSLIHIFLNL